jgi:hypothetical protein
MNPNQPRTIRRKPATGGLKQKITQIEELNQMYLTEIVRLLNEGVEEPPSCLGITPAQANVLRNLSDTDITQIAKCGRSLFSFPLQLNKDKKDPAQATKIAKFVQLDTMLLMLAAEISRSNPVESPWMLGIKKPQVDILSTLTFTSINKLATWGRASITLPISKQQKHIRSAGELSILSDRVA